MPTQNADVAAAAAALRAAAEAVAAAASADDIQGILDQLTGSVNTGRLNTLERRLDEFISGKENAGHAVWPGSFGLISKEALAAGDELWRRIRAAQSSRAKLRHDLRQEENVAAGLHHQLHHGGPFPDAGFEPTNADQLRELLRASNTKIGELAEQIRERDEELRTLATASQQFVVVPLASGTVFDPEAADPAAQF